MAQSVYKKLYYMTLLWMAGIIPNPKASLAEIRNELTMAMAAKGLYIQIPTDPARSFIVSAILSGVKPKDLSRTASAGAAQGDGGATRSESGKAARAAAGDEGILNNLADVFTGGESRQAGEGFLQSRGNEFLDLLGDLF